MHATTRLWWLLTSGCVVALLLTSGCFFELAPLAAGGAGGSALGPGGAAGATGRGGQGGAAGGVGCAAGSAGCPAPEPLVEVAAGGDHTCVRWANGTVKCWGDNGFGQLGLGDTDPRGDTPEGLGEALPAVDLGTPLARRQLVLSYYSTCVLFDNGAIKCWGKNEDGELGLGDDNHRGDQAGEMGTSLPFVDVGDGTPRWLATGGVAACVEVSGEPGRVRCWGSLSILFDEQIGDQPGEMGTNLMSFPLVEGTAIRQLQLDDHMVALTEDQKVAYCEFVGPAPPPDCQILDLGGPVASIQTTIGRTCAVRTDGEVKCWGYNGDGQLGLGDDLSRYVKDGVVNASLPSVDLGAGAYVVQVVLGLSHTCARLQDGRVKCWGVNDFGQLGLGNMDNRGESTSEMGDALPYVDLGTDVPVVELTAGRFHTCARFEDNTVKCWGDNLYGQLGLGNKTSHGSAPGLMGDKLPVVPLVP